MHCRVCLRLALGSLYANLLRMSEILHDKLPYRLDTKRNLPAVTALDPDNVLIKDHTYADQMAERERLINDFEQDVICLEPKTLFAAQELLDFVLRFLPRLGGFIKTADHIICPDGRQVVISYTNPLASIGRLVQNDFCLLIKKDEEHILSGAILCFPASWSLEEQFLRPLSIIHTPIAAYDSNVARRVQRLFDGVKPNRPIWRHNELYYDKPDLYQPRKTTNRRPILKEADRRFLRSERQVIFRLPRSNAVIFSIHTHVLKM